MRICGLCGEPIRNGQSALHHASAFTDLSGAVHHVERDVMRAVHTRCYLAADPGEVDALLDAYDDEDGYPPTG